LQITSDSEQPHAMSSRQRIGGYAAGRSHRADGARRDSLTDFREVLSLVLIVDVCVLVALLLWAASLFFDVPILEFFDLG
jgi:hypothetical protein